MSSTSETGNDKRPPFQQSKPESIVSAGERENSAEKKTEVHEGFKTRKGSGERVFVLVIILVLLLSAIVAILHRLES